MPKDMFAEDRAVESEDALQDQALKEELALVLEELELMKHPSWPLFLKRLEGVEKGQLETLVYVTDSDTAATARAHVRLARDLLGLEGWLQSRVAELRAKLAPEV